MKEQLEQKELGSLQKQAEPLEYLYFTYLAITCCSSPSVRSTLAAAVRHSLSTGAPPSASKIFCTSTAASPRAVW